MSGVFDLIFNFFSQVVRWLKMIPLTDGVSLFDFSLAILIMSIIVTAFVSTVKVGAVNHINNGIRESRREQRSRKNVKEE